jgi:hypothetical protein
MWDPYICVAHPRGYDRINSAVTSLSAAGTVLCRTNATAMSEATNAVAASGRKVATTGGGREILALALAEAAITLKAGTGTSHPELFAFRTWGEVQDYADNDPGGSDLQVLVKLIDDYGPETIIDAVRLRHLSDERYASLIISTAHKAKGREWDSVRIAGDLREPRKDPEKPDELPQISPPEAMLAAPRIKSRMNTPPPARPPRSATPTIVYPLTGLPNTYASCPRRRRCV